jgi:hypothetical protein
MHLGFHIYDVGFQSPNAEASKPTVFTTSLLLVGIIAVLNLSGIWLRSRLRRRFRISQFCERRSSRLSALVATGVPPVPPAKPIRQDQRASVSGSE